MLEKEASALEIVRKEGTSQKYKKKKKKSLKYASSHSALQKFMFKLAIPLSCSGLLEGGSWFLEKEESRGGGEG